MSSLDLWSGDLSSADVSRSGQDLSLLQSRLGLALGLALGLLLLLRLRCLVSLRPEVLCFLRLGLRFLASLLRLRLRLRDRFFLGLRFRLGLRRRPRLLLQLRLRLLLRLRTCLLRLRLRSSGLPRLLATCFLRLREQLRFLALLLLRSSLRVLLGLLFFLFFRFLTLGLRLMEADSLLARAFPFPIEFFGMPRTALLLQH